MGTWWHVLQYSLVLWHWPHDCAPLRLGRLAVRVEPRVGVRHEDAVVALGAGVLLDVAGAAGREHADGAVARAPVGCLVRHGHGAVVRAWRDTGRSATVATVPSGARVLVVVADQALLHHRVRARPLRHGVAVRRGRVAALAEEARLDEVLVVDADAALADGLEQRLVGVAAPARLVQHEAEDGLLVVAGELRDRLLQSLELGREEEERPRLGVALLAVHVAMRRLLVLVHVRDVALAGAAEARRRRGRRAPRR